VAEWWERHAGEPAWFRAAGVYVRMLSTPQLFIEGNHRTGALVMSYILLREGLPPFVLSVDNAAAYFKSSTALRDIRKHSPAALFRLPGIRRRLAALLARTPTMATCWPEAQARSLLAASSAATL
jgi:hypothetical protein